MRKEEFEGTYVADSKVKAALEIIKAKKGLSIDSVLEAAKNPSSPLHEYIEWDDSKAGAKYRRYQAYQLIAANFVIKEITQTDAKGRKFVEELPTRAFPSTRAGDGKFVDVDEALADPDIRGRNVIALIAELRSWVRRAGVYRELRDLRNAVVSSLELAPVYEKGDK